MGILFKPFIDASPSANIAVLKINSIAGLIISKVFGLLYELNFGLIVWCAAFSPGFCPLYGPMLNDLGLR